MILIGQTCPETAEIHEDLDVAFDPQPFLICAHEPGHDGLHWDPVDNINWQKAETL
ncbi:MAG TPA: hypothetical protein VGG75_42550 [Trebonia sp.]|jgi:hypothetical protein